LPSADAVTLTASYERDAVGTETAERIVASLVGAGLFVREVVPRAASLEQVFAELTRSEEEFVEEEARPSPSDEPGKDDA
jgi:ABC-2 type transport system ATP-binding protein